MNLQRTHQSPLRRLAGRVALTLFMATGAWSAWAAHADSPSPPATLAYDVAIAVDADGATSAPRLVVHAGHEATIRVGNGAREWAVTMTFTPSGSDAVFMRSTLTADGEIVSRPGLLMRLGEKGTIKVADPGKRFTMELTVRKAAATPAVPAPVGTASP